MNPAGTFTAARTSAFFSSLDPVTSRAWCRARLEVIGIVAPSPEATIIERLSETDLRELLCAAPPEDSPSWICRDCGGEHDRARHLNTPYANFAAACAKGQHGFRL